MAENNYNVKQINKFIDRKEVKTIFELGARTGHESLGLSTQYPNAIIHAFECNPHILETTRNVLKGNDKIILHEIAVSDITKEDIFYPTDNFGSSSLYKATLGKWWGDLAPVIIQTTRLDEYMTKNNIEAPDLICADIQGGELNAFIGMGKYFNNVQYVITEMPVNVPSYESAPTHEEILNFMHSRDFVKCVSCFQNIYEIDVLFTKKYLNSVNEDYDIQICN